MESKMQEKYDAPYDDMRNQAFYYGYMSSSKANCPYRKGSGQEDDWLRGRAAGEAASKSGLFRD